MIEIGERYWISNSSVKRLWNPYAGKIVRVVSKNHNWRGYWNTVVYTDKGIEIQGVYHEDELKPFT